MPFDLTPGKATKLKRSDFDDAAKIMKCDPDVLRAIWRVESGKSAFNGLKLPTALFEKHVFYRQLSGAQRQTAVRRGLARKAWIHPSKGGYKDQGSQTKVYELIMAAADINAQAAFNSFSMGGPQIMGFNATKAGFKDAFDMFAKMKESEKAHLTGLMHLLHSFGLINAIRTKDWKTIARKYNGSGQVTRYAKAMANAYAAEKKRTESGRWHERPAPVPEPRDLPKPTKPGSAPKRTLIDLIVDIFTSLFGGDNR